MKTSNIFAVAALSFAAFAGVAQAEEYQGVQPATMGLSRAEVQAQAVAAAHAPSQNVPLASLTVGSTPNSRDRAAVRAEAVAAAHDSTQNLDQQAFVNSTVPAQLQDGAANTQRAGL